MDEREEYLVNRIKALEESLEKAQAGTKEIMTLVDALLAQVTMEFGVKEPNGGYRVKLPMFDARELLGTHEIGVEKDDFEYVIRTRRLEA